MRVIQVKQTGGPTIFTVADDSGIVFCAAFERAGVRAYAEIDNEMIVRVIGEVTLRNNQIQIEIKSMKRLWGGEAAYVKDQIEQSIDKRAEPSDPGFLVESDIMTRLRPAMKAVAKEIRRAILKIQAHCCPTSCRCRRYHSRSGYRDGHSAAHKRGRRS